MGIIKKIRNNKERVGLSEIIISLVMFGFFSLGIPFGVFNVFDDPAPATADGTNLDGLPVVVRKDLRWVSEVESAPWEARDSGEVFVFQDKMWIIGGLNGNSVVQGGSIDYWTAPHFNDIWNSYDGVHWNQVATKSEWEPRRSMSVVYFNDLLWMFGGWSPVTGYMNDIWSSADGIQWTKVADNANWSPREGQLVEVFNNKIWLIGGVNYDDRETKNDVWYSEDGITWVEVEGIPWEPRWDHATAVFDGKLFLTGGMDLEGSIFRDVWVTTDGLVWQLVTDNPSWEARQGHSMESYDGKLWLIGRFNDESAGGPNNVWYSEDGVLWKKNPTNPQWRGREDFFSTIFKGKVWVFGGMDADWKWRNDVWSATLTTL